MATLTALATAVLVPLVTASPSGLVGTWECVSEHCFVLDHFAPGTPTLVVAQVDATTLRLLAPAPPHDNSTRELIRIANVTLNTGSYANWVPTLPRTFNDDNHDDDTDGGMHGDMAVFGGNLLGVAGSEVSHAVAYVRAGESRAGNLSAVGTFVFIGACDPEVCCVSTLTLTRLNDGSLLLSPSYLPSGGCSRAADTTPVATVAAGVGKYQLSGSEGVSTYLAAGDTDDLITTYNPKSGNDLTTAVFVASDTAPCPRTAGWFANWTNPSGCSSSSQACCVAGLQVTPPSTYPGSTVDVHIAPENIVNCGLPAGASLHGGGKLQSPLHTHIRLTLSGTTHDRYGDLYLTPNGLLASLHYLGDSVLMSPVLGTQAAIPPECAADVHAAAGYYKLASACNADTMTCCPTDLTVTPSTTMDFYAKVDLNLAGDKCWFGLFGVSGGAAFVARTGGNFLVSLGRDQTLHGSFWISENTFTVSLSNGAFEGLFNFTKSSKGPGGHGGGGGGGDPNVGVIIGATVGAVVVVAALAAVAYFFIRKKRTTGSLEQPFLENGEVPPSVALAMQ